MGDAGDCPDSPPLPRGSYNINFDELDDTVDPFKPRGGLSNSPGKEISNPFQSKSKLASSPPKQAIKEPVVENHQGDLDENDTAKEEKVDIGEDCQSNNNISRSPAINIKKPVKGKKKKVKKVQNETKASEGSTDINEHLNEENPFQTKSNLGQSPSADADFNEENPFQTKSKLGQSPSADADFNEENPFQTKSKLGQSPSADTEFNEENPFKTKSKLGHSPTSEEDPFQSKSNLKNSPQNVSEYLSEENPFQTKSKMGVSPPEGNIYIQDTAVDSDNRLPDVDTQNESVELIKTAEESPDKGNKGLKTRAKSQTPPATKPVEDSVQEDVEQDGGSEPIKPKVVKPEKKAASPKKSGIKKPKARSKFKPPANFGEQNTDDVVIFAPPSSQSANNDTASDQVPAENEEPFDKLGVNEDSNVGTNHMATSEVLGRDSDMIDSVHDFGACEMPMDSNEDFVPASEAFNEDEAWDMMEKMKHENGAPIRDSLSAFDPLSEEKQVPDKVTRRSSDGEVEGNSHIEDEDLLLMNTPPQQKQHSGSSRGVARHPAARALQQHVDGDGAPKEAHVVDKMLFSPVRGEDGKPRLEGGEKYFDAPEYPLSSHKSQSENEVERMNAANKKHGTANENSQDNIVQLVQVLKYSQSDWNKMKQDLELDFNARILNKEREWSKKLADRDKKISYLEEQVLLLRSSNDDMKLVVTEFEKTIAQLQAEKVKTTTESQQGYEDLVKERDQALEDLQSVETAFSDLHQRYERTKGVVEGFKKNEDVLKKCVQDYQNKLKAAEDKTVSVRQQAEEKLALASDEMDKLRKSTTSEVARLEAAYKKADLKIQGLERSLEQKMQENSELTAICDELIAKVSTD